MAYTVGSASVEIVPDFRNAQLAITAFFRQQADEIKIPVKPQMDRDSVRSVERDAAKVGNSVGKAISDGVSKNIDRTSIDVLGRDITKLENDIEKARNVEVRATAALQRAEDRLREARSAGNRPASQMLSLEQALEREQGRVAEVQRSIISSTDRLREARRRLAIETQKVAADAAGRSLEAQQRADDAAIKASIKSAERAAAERNRILQQEIRERTRVEERYAREEEQRLKAVFVRAAKEAQQALKDADRARVQVELDDKQIRDKGREAGGLVTKSINHEIHQNAGLIAGVLAGVFAVGAPAFIAAATGLFGGLGALLVAQGEEVRSSWLGLFQQITTNAEADASVLIGTFERVSVTIGQTFQNLRPLLREAFAAVGPQVESFSTSLAQTAEYALPGLVNAVKAAGPVIHGLGTFMEEFGLGFSEFFDVLATHAPAAGTAFGELGRTFREILPTLAELLGQGAELAANVLPVLTAGFSGLNVVVNALGGGLPILGAAFLAFRSVQGVGRFINNLSGSLKAASESGGLFAGVQGRASTALGAVAKAAPLAGAAVGLYAALSAESTQQTNDWAQALNEGGAAADASRAAMERQDAKIKDAQGGWKGLVLAITGNSAALGIYADDVDNANQQHADFLKSLTPLEAAQRNLDIATRNLAKGLGDESLSAGDLASLQADVADASAAAAREQENLEVATRGVTTAMLEQSDQARALVDAQFGYEKASRKARDAQDKYNAAVKESGAGSTEAADALEVFNEALLKQVDAAEAVATSKLPATMTDNQKRILGAKGALDELNALIAQGFDIPPEMEDYRQRLLQITGQADGAALAQAELSQAVGNLGFTVDSLPGTKTIEIHAPTDELQKKLHDLGFTIVELPNGDITVQADTDKAVKNLGNLTTLLNDVDTATPTPKVSINDNAFTTTYKNLQANVKRLDGERPKPVVSLEDNPFAAVWGPVMGRLAEVGRQRPAPTVSLHDLASSGISGIASQLQSLHDRQITITSVYRQIGSIPLLGGIGRAHGGAVGFETRDLPRYDGGGATVGRGGPLDDLNTIRVSPGEHVLDARDVALMGGQAGVYAFREMLNAGKLGRPASNNGVRQMVAHGAGGTSTANNVQRNVTIMTSDNPRAILRAIRADEQQQAALASSWG